MSKDKQLFLISVYEVSEEGVVVSATKPEWFVESDNDVAKAKALKDYLDKDGDYRAKILQQFRFQ